jgi:CarD family transcriptional regulator, regulator of rRNA transcription
MTFGIGSKVVYPSQGPCLIGAVEDKVVGGRPTSFYRLTLLDDSGDAVFVPVEKVRALRIRQLLAKSEVPKLLSHLESSMTAAKNWKQRTIDNAKLLSSGSAFDLAIIVESLTELNKTKVLTLRDRQTLDKAKKFLICEIAEVMGQARSTVEEYVDKALGLQGRDSGDEKEPALTLQHS